MTSHSGWTFVLVPTCCEHWHCCLSAFLAALGHWCRCTQVCARRWDRGSPGSEYMHLYDNILSYKVTVTKLYFCMCSVTQLCLTLYNLVDIAHQDPLSMEFSRQEHWSGLPFPSPGDLPSSAIEPVSLASPALAGWSLPLSHLESPSTPEAGEQASLLLYSLCQYWMAFSDFFTSCPSCLLGSNSLYFVFFFLIVF